MSKRVRRSAWAVFRLALAATILGGLFAFTLGQMVPTSAIAG